MNVTQRRMVEVAQMKATAREVIMGNKERTGQKLLGIYSYFYTADFQNIAAGTNATYNIQTQGNSDFLITYLMGAIFNSSTQAIIGGAYARLSISDNVTQLPMMNIPAYFTSVCGTAGFPLMLQDPRLISATTIIQVTYYNDMTVGPITSNAQVTLGGFRAQYAN